MRLNLKPAVFSAVIIILSAIAILLPRSAASAAVVTPSAPPAAFHESHYYHLEHMAHLQHLDFEGDYTQTATASYSAPQSSAGTYSFSGLEDLWVSAGGPASVEWDAATIAECESGGRVNAYNTSGATSLFQILGQVVPGNLWDPYVNALNAVAKYRAAGDSFAPWVCQA